MVIEALIISYLIGENLAGIGSHVYAETPVDPPESYVLVRRTGGGMSNYIRDYNVYTETISSKDKLTAATLHEEVIGAMLVIRDTQPVFRCGLNSDYDATRADRNDYRFQALWQITV